MRPGLSYYVIFLLLVAVSCYKEEEIPVVIDFDYAITGGSYTVPVELTIANRTTGADFYTWTFDGAAPASSHEKQPGAVVYDRAGTYTIRLEAWNDTRREVREITVLLDSAVTVAFATTIEVNDFAPATVVVHNTTRGASTYTWTFEGGEPATSTAADPGAVYFSSPGDHRIGLVVTNGRETFESSQVVNLKPRLAASFSIIPAFEDEDYEAPLTATLDNATVSALRYQWTSTGGTITDATAQQTDIHFDAPGDYTVTLHAENDKDAQDVVQTIHVSPNTNLYTMTDVKLGMSSAHATVGCFYAASLRSVLTKSEVTAANSSQIDLVFFSINAGFTYCRFLSPDSAAKFAFPAIPAASHTYIINMQAASGLSLDEATFEQMTDDAVLAGLDIRTHQNSTEFFTGAQGSRVVLFETKDGRRGAIHLKTFESTANPAYILTDIKIQKEARP